MKRLPDMDIGPGPIYKMINGRVTSQILLTAIELNIFDCLSSEKSCEEIADRLKTHRANTGLLLDGLTAAGLLEKKNGLYRNKAETEMALTRKSPAYVGEMLLMMNQMAAGTVASMTHLVQAGPPTGLPDLGSQEIWARYARSMANYQRGGSAQKMAKIVSKLDEFASFEKMLDLGGGHGLFGIAMVAEHPTMKGVIFDQPAVTKVAEEFIAEYRMQDRVTTMAGDYTKDPIGNGYDLVWTSATLNFVRQDLAAMFARIYEALAPGGAFISLAEGATHERTRPALFVLENLTYGLAGQDQLFNKGEIAAAMVDAGFSSVQSISVDTPMTPLELDIARKPKRCKTPSVS